MNNIATNNSLVSIKFGTLSFVDNGLIVTKKNKEVTPILFSELNKIYIKKYKFSFLNKIGLTSILLILSIFLVSYFPAEIVMLASIFYIPLFVKMHTYKIYKLHLLLCDGTIFCKGFYKNDKYDYINLVSNVRKEIFYNQIQSNIQIIKPVENIRVEEEFVYPTLNIA
jgi:hypothetical protein